MHVQVLLVGRLVRLGQQAECEVIARRTSRSETGETIYTDPVIIQAPKDLPEGEYTLFFENVSTPVLHKGVLWMLSGPPPAKDTDTDPTSPIAPQRRAKGLVNRARRMIRDRRKRN